MPGSWGRRRSAVNVEDPATASQSSHQRDDESRVIASQDQAPTNTAARDPLLVASRVFKEVRAGA